MRRTPKFNVGKQKLSAKCEPCELPSTPFSVSVRFCVFFDGTGNNKFNVNQGRQFGPAPDPNRNASYHADYSNVARLSNAFQFYTKKYDIQFAMYVVGVGTGGDNQDFTIWGKGISNKGKSDGDNRQNDKGTTADSNVFGAGLAVWRTGILERSRMAFFRARDEIDRRIKVFRKKKGFAESAKADITSVEIDAFGFSRGAATARNFVTRVLDGWFGGLSFGWSHRNFSFFLSKIKKIQTVGQIKFVFLGLYDTVASHGYFHFNDVKSLKLDRLSLVERVVHLCAADEHRKNFALTNIKSAGSRGVEIFLPGSHSDVGGGYRNGPGDAGVWVFYRPTHFLERFTELWHHYIFRCKGGPGGSVGEHTISESHPRPIHLGEFLNKRCSAGFELVVERYEPRYKVGDWMESNSWVHSHKAAYEKEQIWLEQSGWYRGLLERPQKEFTSEISYGVTRSVKEVLGISSKRPSIGNRYEFIPLRMMADFARDPRWSLKFNRANIDRAHSIEHIHLLRQVKGSLESYIAAKCGSSIPTSVGVGSSSWRDWFSHPEPCDKAAEYPWLAPLRAKYLHFSAHIENGWEYIAGVNEPWYVGERRERPWYNG